MKNKNLIINSSALFVIATILHMTLHEKAHFIAATLLGAKDVTLYHNYVQYDSSALPLSSKMWIAAAGPLFSLILGMGFHFICSVYKKRNNLFLFFLYLCSFSYIAFFGYLAIAPFFVNGDTGFIFSSLGFPIWLTALIAIAGVAVFFLVLKKVWKYFIEMAPADIIADMSLRRPFANALLKYPLYIGIVVTTLLNLPAQVFLSLIYPLCSPFALMWFYGYLVETPYSGSLSNTNFEALNKIQPVWLVVLALVIIMNRLLVFGFTMQ